MAGNGPAPAEKRRRRSQDTFAAEQTIVAADAKPDRFPPLPGATTFSRATQAWYRTWCASPQATLFLPTDWQRLHMLAPLVGAFYADPTPKAFVEIRLSESLLGRTRDAGPRRWVAWRSPLPVLGSPRPTAATKGWDC